MQEGLGTIRVSLGVSHRKGHEVDLSRVEF